MKPIDLPDRHMQTLLGLLAQHVPQAEVWAFGNRVNGTAHEGSDLDLVLRIPNGLAGGRKEWGDLKEALEDSSLPMLVELHDWAYLPKSFHEEIQRCYVVLQEPQETANGIRATRRITALQ